MIISSVIFINKKKFQLAENIFRFAKKAEEIFFHIFFFLKSFKKILLWENDKKNPPIKILADAFPKRLQLKFFLAEKAEALLDTYQFILRS
jgi:hypothetical protein